MSRYKNHIEEGYHIRRGGIARNPRRRGIYPGIYLGGRGNKQLARLITLLFLCGIGYYLLYKFWVVVAVVASIITAIYVATHWRKWKRNLLWTKVHRLEHKEKEEQSEKQARGRLAELEERQHYD